MQSVYCFLFFLRSNFWITRRLGVKSGLCESYKSSIYFFTLNDLTLVLCTLWDKLAPPRVYVECLFLWFPAAPLAHFHWCLGSAFCPLNQMFSSTLFLPKWTPLLFSSCHSTNSTRHFKVQHILLQLRSKSGKL